MARWLRPDRCAVAPIVAALLVSAGCAGGSNGSPAPTPVSGPWHVTWSDEFDGPDNSAPDPGRWTYDIGGWGWGNDELESYTSRRANVFLRGGMLVIRSLRETYTGPDGIERPYTSARVKTQGLFEPTHGRFEARIRVPRGQGIWPAFWLLGANVDGVGWPGCGEIDIFENIGREPTIVHGTMHGPLYSGSSGPTVPYTSTSGPFADDFHVFGLEWEANVIRWYVDGKLYETRTPADIPRGAPWVFEHPFFIIINVAVGGSWPGNPDETTSFPQEMLVDWVRVSTR